MHTISPIVTWPSWSDLALYTEYIIFWAALPSPCSDYISCIILKPFLQSFGLCFSNFGSLVIVQITHFLFTSPLWQLFILWHVFSPSHFGSFILWDVFSPDCDSCLLWHAFYSWMGFGFFMRLLFTFLLRHSSFCGMYLILVTALSVACVQFMNRLVLFYVDYTLLSLSYCDSSSLCGICSVHLFVTTHYVTCLVIVTARQMACVQLISLRQITALRNFLPLAGAWWGATKGRSSAATPMALANFRNTD